MKTETHHQGLSEPIVFRVTIDRLRQEMVHAIMVQNNVLQEQIAKAVDEALKQFRFDDMFYEALYKDIRHQIDMIASEQLSKAFANQDLRDTVGKATLAALKKKIAKKVRTP